MYRIKDREKEATASRSTREGGRRREDSYSNMCILLIMKSKYRQCHAESVEVNREQNAKKSSRVMRRVKGIRIFSLLSLDGEGSR